MKENPGTYRVGVSFFKNKDGSIELALQVAGYRLPVMKTPFTDQPSHFLLYHSFFLFACTFL